MDIQGSEQERRSEKGMATFKAQGERSEVCLPLRREEALCSELAVRHAPKARGSREMPGWLPLGEAKTSLHQMIKCKCKQLHSVMVYESDFSVGQDNGFSSERVSGHWH